MSLCSSRPPQAAHRRRRRRRCRLHRRFPFATIGEDRALQEARARDRRIAAGDARALQIVRSNVVEG